MEKRKRKKKGRNPYNLDRKQSNLNTGEEKEKKK